VGEKGELPYQSVDLEEFLALGRQVDRHDRDLPPFVSPSHSHTQRSSNDLVAEADADDTHAGLGEHFLRELDEPVDPRDVREGIVF